MTTLKIDLKGKTKLPGIAPINGKDINAKALQATKENVEVLTGVRGNTLDQAVTYRALIDQGIVELARTNIGIGSNIIEIVTPVDPDDLEVPPTPTGLAANATFQDILLSWDQIWLNNYSNYSHTEVYRHTSDAIGNALVVFTTSGAHFTDSVGYNTRRYYWVRHVSKQNIKSPYHPTVNGVTAITLASVSATMTELSEGILNMPGYSALINTTIPALIDNAGASSSQIIRSDDAPTTRNDGTSALQGVDIWIDTNDNNQMYVRNVLNQPTNGTATNTQWIKARDGTLVTLANTINTTVGDSGSGLVQSVATAQADIISATTARTALSTSITNLTATVDTKTKTFIQTSAPTATAVGDIWIDSDDGNKMYRASAVGASNWVSARDTTIATAQTAASSAITSAAGAQSTADGKVTTFFQNDAPTAEGTGDLWMDTNDGNKLYRWNGSAWAEIQDDAIGQAITNAATAQSTADGKIISFYQNDAPTATSVGDLWVDTNDGNRLYRATATGTGNWVSVRDTTIAAAQTAANSAATAAAGAQGTADGKVTTFFQDGIPTSGVGVGDLWIDTNDGNKLYRAAANGANEIAAGEWVEIQDDAIATAITNAATAQSTADGKIVTFYQTSAPTATSVGDLWVDTDDSNKLYRSSATGTGNWVAVRDTTNDGYPRVFTQAAAPSAISAGDLWFDTDDSNKQYRATGSGTGNWVEVRDVTTKAAVETEATARASADTSAATTVTNLTATVSGKASTTALDALTAATTATGSGVTSLATKITALETTLGDGSGFATASALTLTNTSVTALQDGKNQSFTGTSEPVNNAANALKAGDLWIDTDDNNAIHRWSGSTWADHADGRITSTASSLTNLTAKVGTGNDADGTAYSASNTLAQHITTTENNAQSSLVLQTDANGAVAQMILHSEASAGTNPQSVITFKADTFAVWDGSGAVASNRVAPFIIDSGVVYMDIARIKDGAIESAKIGSLNASTINAGFINVDRIEASTIAFNKLDANTVEINTAMITNLAVGTAQIANAAITNAKIGSLYANVINGDVSKSASASMASSQTWNNLLSTATTYDYQDLLTVNLQKPTHATGWSPYASFHINKMSTDKNSWSHIKLEMAIWNVNSVGTTANETATSGTTMSAFGTGFTGATIYNNYMSAPGQSQSITGNEATLTWSTSGLLGDEDGRINTSIAPATSDFITDGTNIRPITSSQRFVLSGEVNVDSWIITYGTATSGDEPISAWGSGTIYFREAIASGAVGKYMTKSKVDWIAVDGTGAGTAFNDTAIAATWYDGQGNTTIATGVKAKMSISGHQQHGSSEQDSGTQTVYSGTGFLLGVR